MRRPFLLAAIGAALLLASCSSDAPVDITLPAAFDDGVPEPAGEVILSIETAGVVSEWDRQSLSELDQVERTQLEPFIQEVRTFRGPLLTHVLAASGVDVSAGSEAQIELIALDDFRATLPADASSLEGVMLATLDGGAIIPLEEGGPIRVIFPEENEVGENLNNWIWSLRSGVVR